MDRKEMVLNGRTALGIELGSTRIKAVLIGEDHSPIASGDYEWENQYENNIWTYSLDMVWKGLQEYGCRKATAGWQRTWKSSMGLPWKR